MEQQQKVKISVEVRSGTARFQGRRLGREHPAGAEHGAGEVPTVRG